ncbi:MAG: sodium-dependent transporter [Oscillospiraceae bacterium]|nr:sodium-dependent transporter [Oscillospiraceae bacterium]
MMKKRNTFSSGIGFVLAAAGSAVGLGNIWRFPYLAAKYGGGIFLLFYILLVLTFGYTLMIAENAIGRKTGQSALCAFAALRKKWAFLGIIATLVPVIILPYYNVIGGWVIKYALTFVTRGHAAAAQDAFFDGMLASPGSQLLLQLIFSAVTTTVILLGVQKGIEKFSTILMPVLIALAIIVTVYSVTLPGALKGVKYLFVPDFSHFSVQGILAALGQMFYSLSLAMGIMIAYGSYLPKESDLEKNVSRIEIFDTGIAILAGLMIVPAVFAFSGGDESALGKGPGLMFITLPKVFESMGMSTVIGSIFFILVLFAALTSSISIMEAIVSSLCDRFGGSRTKTALGVGIGSFLVGIPPILGYNLWSGATIGGMTILDMMDFITNSVLMPICALLTCVFVVYVIGVNVIHEEVELSSKFKRKRLFDIMIKYIAPVLIALILISSILDAFGILKL